MASRFAKFRFPRFRPRSSTVFLAASGSLGVAYYTTKRRIHADSNAQPGSLYSNYRELLESTFKPHAGVRRVDSLIWAANYPAEDVLSSAYVQPVDWSFWAVYDGHVGPQTASHLARSLIQKLIESFAEIYSGDDRPKTAAIHSAIKDAFLVLDDEIVMKSADFITTQPEGSPLKAMAADVLQAARAGSCALVSFYDAKVRNLHVSVVGDSRAVLGRRRKTEDGQMIYDVHVLSVDQTGRNADEVARLTAEHPDEKLFNGARFLGWGITRTFGNGVMKWSREVQTFMQEKCLGDKPRTTLQTPPYFTAMPEITTTAIEPGDFMVMGSDGLWDCLTNEEVVGLVGLWLNRTDEDPLELHLRVEDEEIIERTDLPVQLTDNKTHYPSWNVKKRFVNVDTNVARHLARNALGGADQDLHHALFSTPPPRARHIRDDVSAVVVFFE